MNIEQLITKYERVIRQDNRTHYVIEHSYNGHVWLDSYPGDTENDAMRNAAYNHADLLPELQLVCIDIEH